MSPATRAWRLRVAGLFGKASAKVWRSIVGATWTLPFRYITFGAQLSVLTLVPGVVVHVPSGLTALHAMTAGVLVGWALRVLDNLLNEFLVFEWVKKFFYK